MAKNCPSSPEFTSVLQTHHNSHIFINIKIPDILVQTVTNNTGTIWIFPKFHKITRTLYWLHWALKEMTMIVNTLYYVCPDYGLHNYDYIFCNM